MLREVLGSSKLWKLCSGKCFESFACLYRADLRWVDSALTQRFGKGSGIGKTARIWKKWTFEEKCLFLSVLRGVLASSQLWKLCSGKFFRSFVCLYRVDLRWVDFVFAEKFGGVLDIGEILKNFK